MQGMQPIRVTDLALSRRLERAEAESNAAFVEARASLDPAPGYTWCEVAGAYAMFDGIGSPLTQSFGLGLFAPAESSDLDALETFFAARGTDVNHEVSPLADAALLAMLHERGYRPVELTTVLHRALTPESLPEPRTGGTGVVSTRTVAVGEVMAWAEASARGWGELPEVAAFMKDFGVITGRSRGTTCFVAELEGEVVATGALVMHGGVALLAGASTIPAWRGRGAQSALLAARLTYAAEQGCDLAMMGAAPGSTSQTNAERQGFRVAYTRTKWHRALGAA
jgi:GNAT superfamily N-acetyltransferase